jgi:hypothetical protein
MSTNILFLTTKSEDYLQDSLLIGLKKLSDISITEWPIKPMLYDDFGAQTKLYGMGFTLYRYLPYALKPETNSMTFTRDFDLIIFGNIWKQRLHYISLRYSQRLKNSTIVFLDGSDHPFIFMAPGCDYYFKRERYGLASFFSNFVSFSIPESKLLTAPPAKIKFFSKHVQCLEAYKLKEIAFNCVQCSCFKDETEYFKDLRASKYGITMKKAGWDCLRHYEIAFNGAVPAFYRFSLKPPECPPIGLIDMYNCVAFDNAFELQEKISFIERYSKYEFLQRNSLEWAKRFTSENVARHIVEVAFSS